MKMKRFQLFEFEDLSWFPSAMRNYMTGYIMVIHELLGTTQRLAPILQEILEKSNAHLIQDCCSGAGGPMLSIFSHLKKENPDISLQLSDLYPHKGRISQLHEKPIPGVQYHSHSIDVLETTFEPNSIQTMICSFHHMCPSVAEKILHKAAIEQRPICIFEISDNEFPRWLWWLSIFPAGLMTLFLTLKVRPVQIGQLLCTYIIPILPFCIAWDGAVSNARTYTEDDLQQLIAKLNVEDYSWEVRKIDNPTPSKMLCLIGLPKQC
jgi:hypothetical protein